jgi:CRISPR-associated protein Cas2
MDRQLCVLVYDVSDDRRRLKIAKRCESSADRVQRSVFEGYYSKAELVKVVDDIREIMEEVEDSLRIYRICGSCRTKIMIYG